MGRRPIEAVGEDEFVRALKKLAGRRGDVQIGIGDDAAVVEGDGPIVLTTDAQAEGVHFRWEWISPRQLGARAFAVSASDVAAMGGRPAWALVALALPRDAEVKDAIDFHRGFTAAAAKAGCALVGGNLARGDGWQATVTVVGRLRGKPLTRRGARPGNDLWIAGPLGLASLACSSWAAGAAPPPAAARAYRMPRPPYELAARLAEDHLASAAIDVSDGLALDVSRLADASGVRAILELDAEIRVPAFRRCARDEALEHVAAGGDDYALVFTAAPRRRGAIELLGGGARRIGRIVRGSGVEVREGGEVAALGRPGFDHFRSSRRSSGPRDAAGRPR